MIQPKAIAIYLPQFHPIRENDEIWGNGFTEWWNVKKAKPQFKGHYQPHIPHKTVGYYDLRNPEVMEMQSTMAKHYGISGFMFYHYWFNGLPLLDTPLKLYKEKVPSAIPYFFCWANENWSKNWDGGDREVFLKQEYSVEDNLVHIKYLIQFFKDEKYIKINNKPVLSIYKSDLIPEIQSLMKLWNTECLNEGFSGIYLINVETGSNYNSPNKLGFDANMEFYPKSKPEYKEKFNLLEKIQAKLWVKEIIVDKPLKYRHWIYNYKDYVGKIISNLDYSKYKKYPCVMPSWDNTSRRMNDVASIFRNSKPAYFERWIKAILEKYQPYSDEENFVFINAWNEWAEGNHLEPCEKFGFSYLEIVKKSFDTKK